MQWPVARRVRPYSDHVPDRRSHHGKRGVMRGHGLGNRRHMALGVSVALLASVFVGPAAARASGPVKTHVALHATPATAHLRSGVVLNGSVTPKVAGLPVTLQRYVGKSWHAVGKAKVSKTGTYSFTVKTPGTPTVWLFRVTRAASAKATAGISATAHVRVVKPIFVVKAALSAPSVVAGAPLVLTGTVRPKASGKVALQILAGRTWHTLTSVALTKASSFTFSTTRPAGSYRLRVVKPFTLTIAGGVSPGMSATVTAPLAPPIYPPVVTTVTLPTGTIGVPYSATLVATSGVAPYAWSSTALPAGLTLSTAGVISGTPTTVGAKSVTVTVTDSGGRTGSLVLSLSVVLRAGQAWAWGYAADGELGNNASTNSAVPVQMVGQSAATRIADSDASAYVLHADGTVAASGFNLDGELGNGGNTGSYVPVSVTGLTGITAIGAGYRSGYAVRADGTVASWGKNGEGELGDGLATSSNVPVTVTGITTAVAVSGGNVNGYALLADGTVRAWGDSPAGQLGNGSLLRSSVPVTVSTLTSVLTGVTAIAAGGNSAYALRSDGTVWAWGEGGHGELGNNSNANSSTAVQVTGLTGVVAIAGGGDAGYALLSNGTVVSWGNGGNGRLGNNALTDSLVPVAVSGLTGVTAVSASGAIAYALTSDGHVHTWGFGARSALGNGSTSDSKTPVTVSNLTAVTGLGAGATSSSAYAIVGS
jgi:alpha-tubulin suppressor-like RCC1 family protein